MLTMPISLYICGLADPEALSLSEWPIPRTKKRPCWVSALHIQTHMHSHTGATSCLPHPSRVRYRQQMNTPLWPLPTLLDHPFLCKCFVSDSSHPLCHDWPRCLSKGCGPLLLIGTAEQCTGFLETLCQCLVSAVADSVTVHELKNPARESGWLPGRALDLGCLIDRWARLVGSW